MTISVVASAAQEPAVARTEQMIAAFKKVKIGVPAAANASAFTEIDSLIDYQTITTRALEPRAAKLTPAQKAEFQTKLHELIRLIAYPDSGDFFRRAKLTFQPLKIDGVQTQVSFLARLPDEDLQVELTLHWVKRADGNLRVVDVSFDGDSLVQDYQNQFSRIIDKDGVKGLFQKIEERRAAVDKAAAGGKAPAAGKGTNSR
ncbi:MAG TPA: ABC transporter substrate-binding protein [Myxococcaceae bacterium]|nr:ABC transporter substrate-binding protein [Myxococcaceae bacterium]